MHRFFTAPENIDGDTLMLEGEDVRHITKVLRIGKEETVEVCDGQGTDYLARIETGDKTHLKAKILDTYPSRGESFPRITLFQGIPKGSKMETIIQKCVETGVFSVIPFSSGRTVVQLKDNNKEKKTVRWQRIAYEAAKQSKRGMIPSVTPAIDFNTMLAVLDQYDLVLVAYENESGTSLKQYLQKTETVPQHVAIIIGPEGGFEEEEIRVIIEAGGQAVSLGERILRTETAGVVMLAQINFYYGQ